jgi:hypothetical protein
MLSRRQLILEALKARAEKIRIADGYQTDAGLTVHLHEAPAFGEDDPETAIAMVVADDELKWHGNKAFIVLPIEFQALAVASPDVPWGALEAILADIKMAIELPDRTVDGLAAAYMERGTTRTLGREPGVESVGVGVQYLVPYREAWGNPQNADEGIT